VYKRTAPPVYKRTAPPVYKRTAPPVYKRTAPPVYKRTAPPVYKRTAPPVGPLSTPAAPRRRRPLRPPRASCARRRRRVRGIPRGLACLVFVCSLAAFFAVRKIVRVAFSVFPASPLKSAPAAGCSFPSGVLLWRVICLFALCAAGRPLAACCCVRLAARPPPPVGPSPFRSASRPRPAAVAVPPPLFGGFSPLSVPGIPRAFVCQFPARYVRYLCVANRPNRPKRKERNHDPDPVRP